MRYLGVVLGSKFGKGVINLLKQLKPLFKQAFGNHDLSIADVLNL